MANDENGKRDKANASETDLFDLTWIGHALLFTLRSLRRHPFLAFFAFALVMGGAIGVLQIYPQRYEVSTTILAGSPMTGALTIDRNSRRDPTRAARELILVRENLEHIVDVTDFAPRYLEARPEALRIVHSIIDQVLGIDRTLDKVREALVDTLEDRLVVYTGGSYADTVTISLQWWDPVLARDVVEAAGATYLEMRRQAEVQTYEESLRILDGHRADLERQLDARLAQVEANREKAKKEDAQRKAEAGAKEDAAAALPAVDRQLVALQAALAKSKRAVRDFEAARAQRLTDLQSQLMQQQTVYASDHPTIGATRRMIDSLREPSDQLREMQAEVRRLEAEVSSRRTRAGVAVVALAESERDDPLRALFEQDPREAHEMDQLRSLRSQLAGIEHEIVEAQLEREMAAAAFEHSYAIVTPARLPKKPAKRYPLLFVAGGMMGGFSLALLASVLLDLRSGRAIERWQVEHAIGLPVLIDLRR